MATVECTGCGKEVNTQHISCPDCGTLIGYSGGTPRPTPLTHFPKSSPEANPAYTGRTGSYTSDSELRWGAIINGVIVGVFKPDSSGAVL